jgi:peptidyl-prolyl cis-trans isomerase SurA
MESMRRILASCLAGTAGLAMLAAPIASAAAQAQQRGASQPRAQQPAPQAAPADEPKPFGLSNNVTLLRTGDPNLRVANAKVNGEIITGTDVDQRVALVVSAAQAEVPAEEMARLRQQVLRNLIDETLQIQAAKTQELPVAKERIDQTYARVAVQNFGQNQAAMDQYLRSIGLLARLPEAADRGRARVAGAGGPQHHAVRQRVQRRGERRSHPA